MSDTELLIAVALSIGATLLFVAVLLLLVRVHHSTTTWVTAATHRQIHRITGPGTTPFSPERLIVWVNRLATLVVLVAGAFVTYAWLTFVLRRFPYTRPLGDSFRVVLLNAVARMAQRIADAVPSLVMLVLVFAIARAVVNGSNALFDAIAGGRIPGMEKYADTAIPTKRIVAALVWMFALIQAYPFMPGSGTEAFTGVSIFVGVLVSLGSSGVFNQIMSSFTLVYARALRVGDFVRIGDVEGTVTHLGMLSMKLKTPRREAITIPNSVVLSDRMTNYTRYDASEGVYFGTSMTVGYDASWRQVQALLLMAAEQTPGIRHDVKPLVHQEALEGFAVRYTLLVALEHPAQRPVVFARLHEHILDLFNESEIQIMTPAYEGDPDVPKVVPRERWGVQPPARADVVDTLPMS